MCVASHAPIEVLCLRDEVLTSVPFMRRLGTLAGSTVGSSWDPSKVSMKSTVSYSKS